MMELEPALVILLAEGLIAMIVLALGMYFMTRNKRDKEVAEIERFVGALSDEDLLKSQMLETFLLENCAVDRKRVDGVLQEVSATERALVQRVIQMFLQRDPSLLTEIDQLISNLSDPYCKLLADLNSGLESNQEAINGGKALLNIEAIEHVNRQLEKQLNLAMQTIDEITAEYTRVFSGNQSALELENSSKKMLQIFRDAEHRIKNND